MKLVEKEEIKSWRLLMSTFQCVYRQLESALAKKNISISRFQILFFLYFEGNSNAITLSQKLLVTRSNMSMFLKRMEVDGLVDFVVPEGKKRPEIHLTIKGSRLFEEIFPQHAARVV